MSDDGSVVVTDAKNIGLFEYDDNLCNTTAQSVTCVAQVDKLNSFLNQITLAGQLTSGVATITVFVDDMGDGTNEDPRNATDTVTVTGMLKFIFMLLIISWLNLLFLVLPNLESRSAGNNNVLTATVASAAVAGAAVAVGVSYFT